VTEVVAAQLAGQMALELVTELRGSALDELPIEWGVLVHAVKLASRRVVRLAATTRSAAFRQPMYEARPGMRRTLSLIGYGHSE
jgi:hypothetical protein